MRNDLKAPLSYYIRRGHYLYFFGYWLYGMYYDLKIARMPMCATIFNKDKRYYPVQSISYPYMNELIKNIEYSSNDVFVDIGCAWGRLLGYLNYKTNISNYVGIEIDKQVASIAKKALKKHANIKIVNDNVLNYIPKEGTIYYLFNPFDENILNELLNKIEREIHHNIKLLYLHPTAESVFEKHNHWQKVDTRSILPPYSGLGALKLNIYEYHPEN